MLGPVVAGGMLSVWGPTAVFYMDALGFFVVAGVVYFLKIQPAPEREFLGDQKKGLNLIYFFEEKKLRYLLGQLFIAMITIFPMFITVLRTFSVSKFGLSSEEFGQVFMYPALGSVLGSIGFAVWKPSNPMSAVKIGIPLTFMFYFLLPSASSLYILCFLMCLMGFSAYLMFAAITVGLQLEVKEEYRGRVSSLIGFAFGCLGPFACFPIGYLADAISEETTLHLFSCVFLMASGLWYFLYQRTKIERTI